MQKILPVVIFFLILLVWAVTTYMVFVPCKTPDQAPKGDTGDKGDTGKAGRNGDLSVGLPIEGVMMRARIKCSDMTRQAPEFQGTVLDPQTILLDEGRITVEGIICKTVEPDAVSSGHLVLCLYDFRVKDFDGESMQHFKCVQFKIKTINNTTRTIQYVVVECNDNYPGNHRNDAVYNNWHVIGLDGSGDPTDPESDAYNYVLNGNVSKSLDERVRIYELLGTPHFYSRVIPTEALDLTLKFRIRVISGNWKQ